ncbi:MAG: glycosyltransferase family 2 protein [Deltaproteobacteria bacterium]
MTSRQGLQISTPRILPPHESAKGGQKPAVSIVLATNRNTPFLTEAINSVAAQSFLDWELVLVDDGSNDSVALRDAIESLPHVTFICQKNGGLAQARNVGCAAASGRFITFLDDDDFWPVDRLEHQVGALEESSPEAIACYGKLKYVDASGHIFGEGPIPDTKQASLMAGFHIGTVMVRTDALYRAGMFNPTLRAAEDIDLILRLPRIGRLVYLPETLLYYRRHSQNMSNSHIATSFGSVVYNFYYEIAVLAGDNETRDAIAGSLVPLQAYYALSAARAAKASLAKGQLHESMIHGKFSLKFSFAAARYILRRLATGSRHTRAETH